MARKLTEKQYQQLKEILETSEIISDPEGEIEDVAAGIIEEAAESGDSVQEVLDDLEDHVEETVEAVKEETEEVIERDDDAGASSKVDESEKPPPSEPAPAPDDSSGGANAEPSDDASTDAESVAPAERTPDVAPKATHWFYRRFGK